MNVKQQTPLTREVQPLPAEWGRLIQKLRWIGLDDEATRLESAISQLPPEERCDFFLRRLKPTETASAFGGKRGSINNAASTSSFLIHVQRL